jgi:hypothetical protein
MISFASAGRVLSLFLCLAALSGCAGYRVGNVSGRDLQGVHSVYVPVAKNASLEPDLQVVVTNDVIRRFENDGTLTVNPSLDADSEFDVTIESVTREPLRSSSNDILITTEYSLTINATCTFVNRKLGKKIFENVTVTGSTTFFTQADINEGQRQALPLASEDLAINAVKLVTEGW